MGTLAYQLNLFTPDERDEDYKFNLLMLLKTTTNPELFSDCTCEVEDYSCLYCYECDFCEAKQALFAAARRLRLNMHKPVQEMTDEELRIEAQIMFDFVLQDIPKVGKKRSSRSMEDKETVEPRAKRASWKDDLGCY